MVTDIYLKYDRAEAYGTMLSPIAFQSTLRPAFIPYWKKAGIYDHIYKGFGLASLSLLPLIDGLKRLVQNPLDYIACNGFGGSKEYNDAILWLLDYIRACAANPNASVNRFEYDKIPEAA